MEEIETSLIQEEEVETPASEVEDKGKGENFIIAITISIK